MASGINFIHYSNSIIILGMEKVSVEKVFSVEKVRQWKASDNYIRNINTNNYTEKLVREHNFWKKFADISLI